VNIRRLSIILASVASLAFAAPALADDAMLSGYTSNGGQVQAEVVSHGNSGNNGNGGNAAAPTAAAATQSSGTSLPFTGLDVMWVLAAGIGLAGLGLVTRRLSSGSRL
jgi:hypothetical protein